jgi:type II secretory pathway pseudopilin PulG
MVFKRAAFTLSRPAAGFSLVEVVVAVGICALAIVTVLGLLTPAGQSVREIGELDDARRVVGAIQAELQRVPISSLAALLDAESTGDSRYFSSRDGRKMGRGHDLGVWAPAGTDLSAAEIDGQKFFLLELERNVGLSPGNDAQAGYLAFNLRLAWPAYLPDGTEITPARDRSVLIVPMAVARR